MCGDHLTLVDEEIQPRHAPLKLSILVLKTQVMSILDVCTFGGKAYQNLVEVQVSCCTE